MSKIDLNSFDLAETNSMNAYVDGHYWKLHVLQYNLQLFYHHLRLLFRPSQIIVSQEASWDGHDLSTDAQPSFTKAKPANDSF